MIKLHPILLAAGTFALGACSSPERSDGPSSRATETPSTAPVTSASTSPSPATGSTFGAPTLALEGLDDLAIGQPVPVSSSFRMRGAQASDTCLLYSSPEFDGVYAIVEDGAVRRITISRGSGIKLVEGVGVGATEKTVLAAFPGFKSEPHTYVGPPAKYLTQPGDDPRLRFEIGEDGKVTHIHVGTKPQLLYVEGCA